MAIIDDLVNRVLNGEGNSDHHVLSIFGIAMSLKPKNILELGIYEGVTSQPLALAAKLNNGKLTSVDNFIRAQNFQKDLETFRSGITKYTSESQNVTNQNTVTISKFSTELNNYNAQIQKYSVDYNWLDSQYKQLSADYQRGLQTLTS